ncbi:MAG TPA: hypothetical protein VFT22_07520 [Kofleriaceae bacterium]|nr:hypothetical protein [Kofleriaceae bacterium]
MTTDHKFSPGDRVIARWDGPGAIVKAAKATALVRLDRGQERSVCLDVLRPETAGDVAKREHEAAMQAWRKRKPETTFAYVDLRPVGRALEEVGAMARAETPNCMRAAAAELLLLADWFEERPVEK